MSNVYNQLNSNNPYAATTVSQNVGGADRSKPGLPAFCMTMFIISFVLCILRVLIVGLGIVGMIAISRMDSPPPEASGALYEVISGIGIAFFGIIGNTLLLLRKPVGLYFGLLLVLAVIGSCFVGITQALAMSQTLSEGPELAGMIVGAGFSMLIRVGLLVAYVMALLKFKSQFMS